MSTLLSGVRARRRAASASIREVCLLGLSRKEPRWAPGGQVTVLGRSYRVEATQGRAGDDDEAPCYVYLTAEGEG
jgi:hypothetical protein